MTRWLLRWVPALAALGVVAVTVSLGNWQMRRADEKAQLQRERDQASAAPPLALTAARLSQPQELLGRRVLAQGAFLDRYTVFIDNRSLRGQAGFHVLTPFLAEGAAQPVLVLRGWVAQDPSERNRLPRIASPSPPVRIEALAQRDLDQALELAKAAPPGPDDRLWQNASIAAVARWSGLALAPVVLRQLGADEPIHPDAAPATSASRGAVVPVRDWVSPGTGVDKHRAYAFQWYSMAALVVFLWSVFAWRSRRSRS